MEEQEWRSLTSEDIHEKVIAKMKNEEKKRNQMRKFLELESDEEVEKCLAKLNKGDK